MEISDELVEKVKNWLGKYGIIFFTWCLEKYGQISAVYMEGGLPHPVHFREGMEVRNFMRSTGLCDDWDANDFDNNWVEVVEKALKLK